MSRCQRLIATKALYIGTSYTTGETRYLKGNNYTSYNNTIQNILASKRKVTKLFVYCFIKLNDIFFLNIVNIMYVVLEWICRI